MADAGYPERRRLPGNRDLVSAKKAATTAPSCRRWRSTCRPSSRTVLGITMNIRSCRARTGWMACSHEEQHLHRALRVRLSRSVQLLRHLLQWRPSQLPRAGIRRAGRRGRLRTRSGTERVKLYAAGRTGHDRPGPDRAAGAPDHHGGGQRPAQRRRRRRPTRWASPRSIVSATTSSRTSPSSKSRSRRRSPASGRGALPPLQGQRHAPCRDRRPQGQLQPVWRPDRGRARRQLHRQRGRKPRHRRRIRLRQIRHLHAPCCACCRATAKVTADTLTLDGIDVLKADKARPGAPARPRRRDDLPGPDDRLRSGVHHRPPDRRNHPRPSQRQQARGAGRGRAAAARASRSRTPRDVLAIIRTSSPAACCSAP